MKTASVIIVMSLLAACYSRDKPDKEFPSFNFLLKDSVTVFNSRQIPNDKPFVLIYFSPDCEECQKETEGLLKNMDKFKNVNFYFLTNDPFDRLKLFDDYYKIYNYKNIVLGWDNQFGYINNFHPTGTPFSILFDKDKKARAVFVGEMEANHLSNKLNKLTE